MLWVVVFLGIAVVVMAKMPGNDDDQIILKFVIAAIAGFAALFAFVVNTDPIGSRLDTSDCAQLSRVWSWVNCADNNLACREYLLIPPGCAVMPPDR